MEEKADKLELPLNEDTPLLLYSHKHTQTFYSISPYTPKASRKCIPQLRSKKILDYSHGWFVLRDWNQRTMFTLFNPITLEVIYLPPLLRAPDDILEVFCALKSPPDRDDCILLLSFNEDGIMFLWSPAKHNCSWLTLPLRVNGEDVEVTGAFTLHGVFYALVNVWDSHVASLYEVDVDVSNSVIFRPWFPVRLPCSDIIQKMCLVESCGHVYLVCMFFLLPIDEDLKIQLRGIRVFQLDQSGPLWREINSLDGRSFFLGWTSSTWCWGITNDDRQSGLGGVIQRNCIYFVLPSTLVPERDSLFSLYSYNLHDHSVTPLRSCSHLMRRKLVPVWVIPPQLRLMSMKERIEKVEHPHHQEVLQPNEGQQTRFTELPLHMIEYISECMHLFEYWNFRASCKIFRSLCPSPSRWRTKNAPPLLIIFKDNDRGSGSCELIDPLRCDSRFSVLPLSPYPFTVLFSDNGWLLNFVDQNYLESYNLFTGARGKHSCFTKYTPADCKSVGFTTYPLNPNCLTAAISACDEGGVFIHLYWSKTRCWANRWCNGPHFSLSNSKPVFLHGAIYFLDRQGNLGVYQGVNGAAANQSWNVYDKPQTLESFELGSLVECQGKLYAVFVEKVGKWVQVFRFDESVMSWVEVKCLENHCLFICRVSSFSLFTRDPRLRNRIYLPRFRGNKMVYYSLDTRKFHVSCSEETLENLYGTSEPFTCCWI